MVLDLVRRLAHRMSQAAGLIILVTAFVVFIDVVLRQAFSAPIGGVAELAGYGLAIVTAWGLSDAFLHRTHIRIDVVYQLMPAGVRTVLDVIAMLVMLATMTYLGRLAVDMWLLAVEFNSRSSQPLFIPLALIQGLWVMGFLVFIAVMGVVALSVGRELARGNIAAVQKLLSPPAPREVIEEEVASLKRRGAA